MVNGRDGEGGGGGGGGGDGVRQYKEETTIVL